jgi:hypothetical protein
MSRRALRAGLCAAAAIAFLLAAFLPWFERWRAGDDGDDGPRATYQLQGGERCERGRCKNVGYTGAPGMRDELFAVSGWATLAGALGTVALTLAVAAARGRQRPLRGWAGASAATTAGLGALFVAGETISRHEELIRGWGLASTSLGALLAGVAIALPTEAAPPDRRPERRWLPTTLLAGGALIAWIALADHGWWRTAGAFRALAASPLGQQVCDGDECTTAALAGGGGAFAALARLTVMFAAALLVPAAGAAARVAQGRAAGAWGIAALTLAALALGCGGAAAALHAARAHDTIGWGLPAFAVGTAAVPVAALLARRWITALDVEDVVLAPTPRTGAIAARIAGATEGTPLGPIAIATRVPGGMPPPTSGAKPVLPSLGAPPSPSPSPSPGANAIASAGPGPSPSPFPVASPGANPSPFPVASPGANALPPPSPPAAPSARPAPSLAPGHLPPAPKPAWAALPRADFVPRPGEPGPSARVVVAAPPSLARRVAPRCPTCKQSTLWHAKRGGWWCTACKKVL